MWSMVDVADNTYVSFRVVVLQCAGSEVNQHGVVVVRDVSITCLGWHQDNADGTVAWSARASVESNLGPLRHTSSRL